MLKRVNKLGRGKSPPAVNEPLPGKPKVAGSMERRYAEVEGKLEGRLEEEWGLVERVDAEMAGLTEEARMLRRGIERGREAQEGRVREVEGELSSEVTEELAEVKHTRKELTELLDKKYRTIKTETM